MFRSTPPIIKIYEALGAIADNRIEFLDNKKTSAKVYSSSRGKHYTVSYDPENNAIMMNDNGSYRKGYLGYPAICVLLLTKKLPLNEEITQYLKDIKRKDINTKHKNDFNATQKEIDEMIGKIGNLDLFKQYIKIVETEITNNPIKHLGKKTIPPEGY